MKSTFHNSNILLSFLIPNPHLLYYICRYSNKYKSHLIIRVYLEQNITLFYIQEFAINFNELQDNLKIEHNNSINS